MLVYGHGRVSYGITDHDFENHCILKPPVSLDFAVVLETIAYAKIPLNLPKCF